MEQRDALWEAAADYRLLLDRGYPVKASLALVGDRWRLGTDERIILFRGLQSSQAAASRRAKLSLPPAGATIVVDLYNVAFTIVHFLIGKPCFISGDGFLRDAGANYGRVPHEAELGRAFGLIATALLALAPARIAAFLDAPVSRSGEHAAAFRSALEGAVEGRGGAVPELLVETAASADGAILAYLNREAREGKEAGPVAFVASSDSVVIDRAERAVDLARSILGGFGTEEGLSRLLDLSKGPA
jgi:hypothetical protein